MVYLAWRCFVWCYTWLCGLKLSKLCSNLCHFKGMPWFFHLILCRYGVVRRIASCGMTLNSSCYNAHIMAYKNRKPINENTVHKAALSFCLSYASFWWQNIKRLKSLLMLTMIFMGPIIWRRELALMNLRYVLQILELLEQSKRCEGRFAEGETWDDFEEELDSLVMGIDLQPTRSYVNRHFTVYSAALRAFAELGNATVGVKVQRLWINKMVNATYFVSSAKII